MVLQSGWLTSLAATCSLLYQVQVVSSSRGLLQAGLNSTRFVPVAFDNSAAPAELVSAPGPVEPSALLLAPSPNQAVAPTVELIAPAPVPSTFPSSPMSGPALEIAPALVSGPAPGPSFAPHLAPGAAEQPTKTPPAPGVIGLPFLQHACGKKQDCLNFAGRGVFYSTNPHKFRELNQNDLNMVDCQCKPGAFDLTYCGPWWSWCCAVQNTEGLCKKDDDCCGGYLCRNSTCTRCTHSSCRLK